MRSAHIRNRTLLPEAQISVIDKMITIMELLEKRTKELEGKLEARVAAITQLGVKQTKRDE
jgi:50S ribosomal subunit-associated GTPase HflX